MAVIPLLKHDIELRKVTRGASLVLLGFIYAVAFGRYPDTVHIWPAVTCELEIENTENQQQILYQSTFSLLPV